jgi:hypothetical protein
MTLSPRDRGDYLLLIKKPTNRQCLEAFATESGIELCRQYPNIVFKASVELPELNDYLDLPVEFVASQVRQFLDAGHVAIKIDEYLPIDDLLDSHQMP